MSLFGGRSDDARERTAEEREQARREREARRRTRAVAPQSEPRTFAAREERVREGSRAGVVDPPQRRIRVEDSPPEPWDEQPAVDGHRSTSESAAVIEPEPGLVEEEPVVYEPEPGLVEEEPVVYEPEPPMVEQEPFVHEPERSDAELESPVSEAEPHVSEPQPRTVEPEPFVFEFERPPPADRELAGSPLEPPGPNGRFAASEAEPLVVEPEPEPAPPTVNPDGAAPAVEDPEAPAREPAEDAPAREPAEDAPAPVAPPLPPRLKRFRQERMEAATRPARGRRRSGRAAPAPRSPRRVAKAAEQRTKPGVRQWIARAVVPLVLVGLLVVGWFLISLYQPFTGDGGERVTLKVPSGLSARDIGDLLADRGVVDSGFFFALRARVDGNREELKAGTYAFRRDMSYADAMAILVKGPPPIKTVTLTLPEGNTVRDFASAVDDSGKVKGSYMRAVRRARFNPRRYGAPAGARLEGFLFPATYEYRTGRGTASDLVSDQLQAFKRNLRGISMGPARRAGLTPYEVLIIASMVERETSVPRERKIVAGVIYNRLRQSIPLGIDATIRYATNNWKRPIRQSELDAPGPYNTRQNPGLPPTPIGNPGLASIKAAANPKRTDFLFFVVKPGGDGEHAFSRTDEEFQRDVARYNTARDARGGRDPR
ncbi:MAG: endolytic transglycosylase MltG [Solirubrobacteraceae bacterium]